MSRSDADRPIRGGLAMGVRRRHAAGESAEAIARALRLRPGDVRAYLASVAARAERRAWRGDGGDDGDVAELPRVDVVVDDRGGPVGAPAARAELPPPPPAAGDWGSVHAPSGRSGNAALSEADAALARTLRSEGVARRDVAAMLGISVATVTRITRGETYRPAAVEPDQVAAVEPPAIAEAEVRDIVRWDPADDG